VTGKISLLSVTDLGFARQTAHWQFNLHLTELTLHPGEHRALVGPSGCGKSTLLDLLALALKPRNVGRFRLTVGANDHDLDTIWRQSPNRLADLRGRFMGYVLQQGGLLPFLTVRENILLPARLQNVVDTGFCIQLAEQLGIDDLLEKRPVTLSVGERQRVGIARALVHRPAILFADEPTASVDAANAEGIAELLIQMADVAGAAMIVATHDLTLVARLNLNPLDLNMTRRDNGMTSTFCG
jgi:putative ABC transport system ATP-binding protein